MNILIPTADYPPIEGGISTVTVQLARNLNALGHTVTVVAPYFPGQEDFDDSEPYSVLRYTGYGLGWFRFFPMLLATWSYVRNTDLILAINIAYGGVIAWLASSMYRKSYITFAYAYEFLKFRSVPLISGLLRSVYRKGTVVVAISRFTHVNLAAFTKDRARIATILPGAPSPTPLPQERLDEVRKRFVLNSGPVILAVGRFIARKGHVTLVQAMPKVLERFPDAQLVLVGQGPCLGETVWAARRLGVRDSITFPGRLEDEEVAALYQICDVFALPTGSGKHGQVEGFGLVFAEAHAYGKPVVAGRSGGVVDAVLDGETGLLVEPGDPEALAEAILAVLDDADLARRLGENGRKRVETELNWEQFTRRMLDAAGIDS